MQAKALQTAPVVDGDVLGDTAWNELVPATGFWQTQPSDGLPATQRTEVFIGYTNDTLYIVIVAYDTDPDQFIYIYQFLI